MFEQTETQPKPQTTKTPSQLLRERVNAPGYIPPVLTEYSSRTDIEPMHHRRDKEADKHYRYVEENQPKSSRPRVIKNATFSSEEVLIGGDPRPDLSILKTDPKPDIAPLPDEITPRIQAEQINKS